MSWSCDICGKGNGNDHTQCSLVKATESGYDAILEKLDRIIELLEEKKKWIR